MATGPGTSRDAAPDDDSGAVPAPDARVPEASEPKPAEAEDAGSEDPRDGGSDSGLRDAAPVDASEPDAARSDGGEDAAAEPDAGTPPSECRTDVAPEIPALAIEVVVADDALSTLSFATQPPGSDDWYLLEQRGRILIVRNGELLPTPFLDLRDEISLGAGFDQTTISYDERGLVGLAFAPDYAQSGLFYITITPSAPDNLFDPGLVSNRDQVLEYRRSDDPDVAEGTPRRTLVNVASSLSALGNIHNANTLRFGPDGFLYVGMGDGGGVNCGDAEPNASQDVGQVFGKILRFDLSRPAPYGAADNPFASVSGGSAVLHYGLRNPFRFNFDWQTGDLYIGDVGQSRYEEINVAPAGSRGLNFGWATFEANAGCPGNSRPLRSGTTQTPPIFAADRGGSGPFRDYRAIVGGLVYRGSALPGLYGTYVFGDYYGTRLGALQRCNGEVSPVAVIRKNCDINFDEPCLDAPASTPPLRELTAIVEDRAGEIFLVTNGNSLLKVVPPH
jgi:glucose/arabinose dehydrogenase